MKELSAFAFKYPTQSVNSLLFCVVVGALGDDVGSVFWCDKDFFIDLLLMPWILLWLYEARQWIWLLLFVQEPTYVWAVAGDTAEVQDGSKGPGPKSELKTI